MKLYTEIKSVQTNQASSSHKLGQKLKQESEYKSDALDDLVESSLFKKKSKPMTPQDSFLDQALKAKVDETELLGQPQQDPQESQDLVQTDSST